jgi:enoyl-CoA hydratase
MAEEPLVLSRVDGPVGVVTLNRARQLNALSSALMHALGDALEAFDADPAITALVVTGGSSVFAAGADLKEMADASAVDMLLSDYIGQWDRLRHLNKPLIAAVGGYALGGGCELALLCDLVIAGDNARFGQPEINVGLMPGAGGTQRLARLVGKHLAMDMILTGRQLGAEEALAHGLASRLVPHEQVVEASVALGREIAEKPSLAVRLAKEVIARGVEGRVDDGIAFERKLFYLLFATADAHEGMHAFGERRKPSYTGR